MVMVIDEFGCTMYTFYSCYFKMVLYIFCLEMSRFKAFAPNFEGGSSSDSDCCVVHPSPSVLFYCLYHIHSFNTKNECFNMLGTQRFGI